MVICGITITARNYNIESDYHKIIKYTKAYFVDLVFLYA